MPLALPSTLGPYLLEEKLGHGGMAEVFKARAYGASGFEKVVAVKTLLPELIGDSQYERMFLEEARLQARVTHSNLVQAHDLGASDGRLYVRLDFVDGVDLATFTSALDAQNRNVDEALGRYVASQLAQGLEALHRATDERGAPLGLVHRDLSPGNVLLSRHGEVKLGDFGIAKATLLRETTRAGVRKGTHAYMSPEQVSGRPLSAASDQFALGLVLHELLFRTRAYEGPTPLETMDLIREARPLNIAGPWGSVLTRLLAKDPADRFASMREVCLTLSANSPDVPFRLGDEVQAVRAGR